METMKTSLRLPKEEYKYLQKVALNLSIPASQIISMLLVEYVKKERAREDALQSLGVDENE